MLAVATQPLGSQTIAQHSPSGCPASPFIRFRNVAAAAGLGFVLHNHPTERKHLIETMPGGVAVFDYDGDGLSDIFFTNGAATPSFEKKSSKYANRLFRNRGGMKFQDVSQKAGLTGRGYSMGAAAADYDNDGHVDLLVLGVGRNFLYRNQGDGTFEEITARSGIQNEVWSVAGAWFDYDKDGWLDLFVVNYLQWSVEFELYCGDRAANVRAYCHPRFFDGLANTLYRNRGDGTFEDVSEKAGIRSYVGKGMSVATADYDLDGAPDLFVTNDKMPNFLFRNRGDGTFEEVGLEAGGALQDSGTVVSSMGVDLRDYNNDGHPDILFTALAGERFPLFRNDARGQFEDVTYSSRMGPLSHALSGWGVGLFDFDNDGWKDVFTANSHVNDTVEFFEPTSYRLHNSVFASQGDGIFQDASPQSCLAREPPRAHRGAGFADFNNDGRLDVVVTSLGGPAELWQNITSNSNAWLRLRLVGTRSNRDAIGARVRIGEQWNQMTSSVGYASSSHAGVHFGLGGVRQVKRAEIFWPSGAVQTLTDIAANQTLEVREPPP